MASLLRKLETALVTALGGVTNNIYPGISYEEKLLPCVIARAASSDDHDPNSGRYIATIEITVKDSASADSDFEDICEAVGQITDVSGFVSSITNDEVVVYGLAGQSRVERGPDGDCWTETRTIQIACALTDQ